MTTKYDRMADDDKALDAICSEVLRANVRNALHACRQNHPLNGPYQWRNAHALLAQADYFSGLMEAVEWLASKAQAEWDAASKPGQEF